jgi:hypothetical protein
VQVAARSKPKVFREKVAQDYPQAIMETRLRLSLNLDNSVFVMWEEFLGRCRKISGDPGLTYEQAFELYLLAPALEELRNASQDNA